MTQFAIAAGRGDPPPRWFTGKTLGRWPELLGDVRRARRFATKGEAQFTCSLLHRATGCYVVELPDETEAR